MRNLPPVAALALAVVLGACAPLPPAARAAALPPALVAPATDDLPKADAPLAALSSVERHTFTSAALGQTMPYYAYLPPGYGESGRRYPVLYLLHGMGGSYEEWRSLGAFDAADRMIRAGEIDPVVIVLPQGDRAYWVDHANGGAAWGRYTASDLVAEIDGRYRTLADASGRAIGGLSMGAHGALQLALNYPGTFGVVGAHSLVLRRPETAPAYFGDPADFAKRDPMTLVTAKADIARSVSLWIDIGEQDPWSPLARQFNTVLDGLQIRHEWRIGPGDHSAAYWSGNLPRYLRYYDRALTRGRTSPPTFAALPR